MTTLRLDVATGVEQCRAVFLPAPSSWTASSNLAPIPQMIPEDEVFFWTPEWQRLEVAAREDLRAGRSRRFSNIVDAARWLLSED